MSSEEHSLQELLRRSALTMHRLLDHALFLQPADNLRLHAFSKQTFDQGLHSAAMTLNVCVAKFLPKSSQHAEETTGVCLIGTVAGVPALPRPLLDGPHSVVREGRAVRHCPPTGKPGQCFVDVSAKATHESIVSSYKKASPVSMFLPSRMRHPVDAATKIRTSLDYLKRAWMHCQNRLWT